MKNFVILISLALALTACSSTNEVKTTTVNAPSANTATNSALTNEPVKEESFTSGANPRADLISAAQKRQNLPFWSAKVTSETNEMIDAEMQYIAPDRYRFKLKQGEVIVIGNDSYSLEEGKWTKGDEGAGEEIKNQITSGIAEGAKNLKDVQIVGKEKFNGKDTTVYTHKFGDASTKVWIADDSGLELKNEVELKLADSVQKQATVYDYKTPVKIEAPKIDK